MSIACAACGKDATEGDMMLSLVITDDLMRADGEAEPANLILSRSWCRACMPHYDALLAKALNLDPRAVGAQGHVKSSAEEHAQMQGD